jgi:hypothetical protein
VTDDLPNYLHIVHTGDHGELADAIATIARYQRVTQHLRVLRINEAKDAAELSDYLTQPAAIVLFTGHGTPDGRIGTRSDCYLRVDDIERQAHRPFSTHGLIMDACYGWGFREAVGRQSSRSLAYLAACGEADYADTQLIVNLAISLVGDPKKPVPQSADGADYAFCQALGPARGLWRHSILEPGRAH